MEREKRTLGPWEGIQRVLGPKGKALSSKHHPSRRVLLAYLSETLPDRPPRWTVDRARALAESSLSDWTAWEVATHLAICPRCRVRVKSLERQPVLRWRKHLTNWHERVRQPRLAPVGWGLAGVQALVIIGLACWLALPPAPAPKAILPEILNAASEAPPNTGFIVRFVQFHQDVSLGELSGFLNELEAEIRSGPGENGQYKLYFPIKAQEALEESPYVMTVRNPEQVGVVLFMGMDAWKQHVEEKRSGKIPWDVYQEALRWQTLCVPFASAPDQELLLSTSKELSQEELVQLVEAGYTLKAVVGTTVLVSAPITLYIDEEKGLQQFDFVTMSFHPIENWPTGGNP